ncbi:Patatin [Turneriella parva DSM 21527]|uniref:Patatin n=2 Tax=Turneriella TaxID=338321 RepID=I4B2B1_TURPD|nr:Patatin [Turneriella parva DSM 21527]
MKKKPRTAKRKPAKKPARRPPARSYALVLSGGAALGAYQAGAIRAIFEAGLEVRCVAGSSIGALNGYLTATRSIGTMLKFWQEIDQRRLITIQSFTKLFFSASPSLLTDQLQRKLVEEHVRIKDLQQASCEYICAAISLNTGKLHYFSGGEAKTDTELQQYILASAAVPGVFPPVQIGHELYMDGGLVRNTPVEAVEHKKVDAVIAISMEPESYPKEPLVNTAQIALRTLSIFFRSQADDAITRAENSRKRKAKKLLLLRPKLPLEMQQYEFDQKKIVRLLEQGYHEAQLFIRHNRLR